MLPPPPPCLFYEVLSRLAEKQIVRFGNKLTVSCFLPEDKLNATFVHLESHLSCSGDGVSVWMPTLQTSQQSC